MESARVSVPDIADLTGELLAFFGRLEDAEKRLFIKKLTAVFSYAEQVRLYNRGLHVKPDPDHPDQTPVIYNGPREVSAADATVAGTVGVGFNWGEVWVRLKCNYLVSDYNKSTYFIELYDVTNGLPKKVDGQWDWIWAKEGNITFDSQKAFEVKTSNGLRIYQAHLIDRNTSQVVAYSDRVICLAGFMMKSTGHIAARVCEPDPAAAAELAELVSPDTARTAGLLLHRVGALSDHDRADLGVRFWEGLERRDQLHVVDLLRVTPTGVVRAGVAALAEPTPPDSVQAGEQRSLSLEIVESANFLSLGASWTVSDFSAGDRLLVYYETSTSPQPTTFVYKSTMVEKAEGSIDTGKDKTRFKTNGWQMVAFRAAYNRESKNVILSPGIPFFVVHNETIPPVQPRPYSEQPTYQKSDALLCAYLSNIAYDNQESAKIELAARKLTLRHWFDDHKTDTQGYVACPSDGTGTVYVVYCGTATLWDLLYTDLLGPFRFYPISTGVALRSFWTFVNAANAVRAGIESTVEQIVRERNVTSIYVTGHSLGAGLSQITTFNLFQQYNEKVTSGKLRLINHTFGCPPHVNEAWQTYANDLLKNLPNSLGLFNFVDTKDEVAKGLADVGSYLGMNQIPFKIMLAGGLGHKLMDSYIPQIQRL
ncbi:MAG TPA: hypothetical protein VF710_08495 [Longimicrobium sp.]